MAVLTQNLHGKAPRHSAVMQTDIVAWRGPSSCRRESSGILQIGGKSAPIFQESIGGRQSSNQLIGARMFGAIAEKPLAAAVGLFDPGQMTPNARLGQRHAMVEVEFFHQVGKKYLPQGCIALFCPKRIHHAGHQLTRLRRTTIDSDDQTLARDQRCEFGTGAGLDGATIHGLFEDEAEFVLRVRIIGRDANDLGQLSALESCAIIPAQDRTRRHAATRQIDPGPIRSNCKRERSPSPIRRRAARHMRPSSSPPVAIRRLSAKTPSWRQARSNRR